MIKNKRLSLLLAAALALLLGACERRELYVYGDEFHSVILEVDWREYDEKRDPDGMTVWFYPLDDPDHGPYRTTTASVRRKELYLPGGRYQGVVIDYSPDEFSRQQFLGMDRVETARVESRPAPYQPDEVFINGDGVPASLTPRVNAELYGAGAWTALQTERTAYREATGLYIAADQPERMALDTLDNRMVYGGEYGEYIPWRERDTYQSTLTVQHWQSVPHDMIWKLRVRIRVREGFNYMWQTPSSISGLADGHLLALDTNTDRACIMGTSEWELQRTADNEGYMACTLTTFGLRPASELPDAEYHVSEALGNYRTAVCLPEALRLNLSFVLRDHATVVNYHFDVGDAVVSYDDQHVLRIDIDPGIVLPYVDAYSGAGFGADVTPWEDQEAIDVGL